jgi:hypothetical protein
MRQRVVQQHVYISPFCNILQIGIFPFMLHKIADREIFLSVA